MRNLKVAVRIFCAVPFLTGSIDLIDGIGLLRAAGFPKATAVDDDAVLNNQIKFWGAIWLGYGALLWRSSSHLRDDPTLFRMLYAILFTSGVARLAAASKYGLPGNALTAAMGLELVAPALAMFAHNRALRTSPDSDGSGDQASFLAEGSSALET